MKSILNTILTAFIFCSCKPGDENTYKEFNGEKIMQNDISVTISQIKREPFVSLIISDGKITSSNEAQVFFKTDGFIKKIYVKNGQKVTSGQLLACLDHEEQQLLVQSAQLQVDESRTEINDLLITQGGKGNDTNSVNKNVFKYIKLKSGYDRARLELQKTELLLNNTYLYAPTNGIIANLEESAYNLISHNKVFCNVVNRSEFVATCYVLEMELSTLKIGQSAKIYPISFKNKFYKGHITNINPKINSDGLSAIRIKIDNPDLELLTGMNARINIEKKYYNQIVVPKNSVIERNNKKVVFEYSEGEAIWHDVETGLENENYVTIVKGLEGVRDIIVSGNMNLNQGTRVKKADKI